MQTMIAPNNEWCLCYRITVDELQSSLPVARVTLLKVCWFMHLLYTAKKAKTETSAFWREFEFIWNLTDYQSIGVRNVNEQSRSLNQHRRHQQ